MNPPANSVSSSWLKRLARGTVNASRGRSEWPVLRGVCHPLGVCRAVRTDVLRGTPCVLSLPGLRGLGGLGGLRGLRESGGSFCSETSRKMAGVAALAPAMAVIARVIMVIRRFIAVWREASRVVVGTPSGGRVSG